MTLDELLLEWSYRTNKGYPCLDNPSDITILKKLLARLNLPSVNKAQRDASVLLTNVLEITGCP